MAHSIPFAWQPSALQYPMQCIISPKLLAERPNHAIASPSAFAMTASCYQLMRLMLNIPIVQSTYCTIEWNWVDDLLLWQASKQHAPKQKTAALWEILCHVGQRNQVPILRQSLYFGFGWMEWLKQRVRLICERSTLILAFDSHSPVTEFIFWIVNLVGKRRRAPAKKKWQKPTPMCWNSKLKRLDEYEPGWGRMLFSWYWWYNWANSIIGRKESATALLHHRGLWWICGAFAVPAMLRWCK